MTAALADRLRAALAASVGAAPAPMRDDRVDAASPPPIAAAVLAVVVDRPAPTLLLTERTKTLRRHPGQVAFPGGRLDPGDADAIAAALREAQEEIALDPAQVAIVGTAEPYRTFTGFEVTPVIGVIPPGLPLVPHEAEVAAVFEVPLAFALASANHVERQWEHDGAVRRYVEMEWDGHRIWGITAAMIVNLARRIGSVLA